jgi:hypothetical protein
MKVGTRRHTLGNRASGIEGIGKFLQSYTGHHFIIWFDIWLLFWLPLFANSYFPLKRNYRKKSNYTYGSAIDAVWLVYCISIFALVFYFNTVPHAY